MAFIRVYYLVMLLAIMSCLSPPLVSAHLPTGKPFHITGSVYCDTCRAGFETTSSTFIAGAKVRLECKDGDTLGLRYSLETVTDSNGRYSFIVEDDKEDQICSCVLAESPLEGCNQPDPGRNRASAVLTRNMNGVVNNKHIVNNMGFLINKPLAGCEELLKKYFPTDEEE